MAAPIAIKAKKRTALGSRANARLRKTGAIPGVIYGHKQDNLSVEFGGKELLAHISHGAHVFNIDIEGKTESVLIKDAQFCPLGVSLLHVDFSRVDLNERVTVRVSIELKGEAKGEKDGAVLQQILSELEIECVVTEIPDAIYVDVSDMGKDSALHVSDIKLPAGTKVLNDATQLVAKCEEIVEHVDAAATAEGAAEPEVIGKKKEDETPAEEPKK